MPPLGLGSVVIAARFGKASLRLLASRGWRGLFLAEEQRDKEKVAIECY
jgi:hypothetical protein